MDSRKPKFTEHALKRAIERCLGYTEATITPEVIAEHRSMFRNALTWFELAKQWRLNLCPNHKVVVRDNLVITIIPPREPDYKCSKHNTNNKKKRRQEKKKC